MTIICQRGVLVTREKRLAQNLGRCAKCSLLIVHWREPGRASCGNAASRLEIFLSVSPLPTERRFPAPTDRVSLQRSS